MKTHQAVILASLAVTGAIVVERLLHKRFRAASREREELRSASEQLKHRNDQLTALYNVFSEITETLSLRYVVNSTLREANNLMGSDMAVLRILRGDELPVIGALTGSGQEVTELFPVKLGEGPSGRAAKKGRAVKIDTDAELTMKPPVDRGLSPAAQTGRPPLESGIVMPLIVGARIVGTLSCWSCEKYAFSSEDERILEMMASQVATAVVAADAMETTEHQAHHDALTDLPNRHQLNEDLEGDLRALSGSGTPAVVAMIDVDRFKMLNDDFGHKVGDVTLQQVASVLRNSVRDHDRLYRYGGEEFIVVFRNASASEAHALADRVRRAVETTPFSGDRLEPVGPVTISMGLALLPEHGTDMAKLIELADKAMYRAKELGRNRVVLWQEEEAPSSLVA
ncbi:MAG TPA: sensor domain-containing diguanylate cyclase [Dehalococcoidia bacterium]|nr:sensor domain-containing diguanylate cyclase [Dehalococcoidia bacterium]